MGRAMSIVHFGFTVSNLDRTTAFFRDCLGLNVLKREHGPDGTAHIVGIPGADINFSVLQGPDHTIELVQYLAPDDRHRVDIRPCDVGSSHISYLVPDIEEFIAAAAHFDVRPLNTTLLFAAERALGVYMRDPDGLTIEILQTVSD
jgi:catechol 2,3-dioxygenase-like lactoylglutathione lyase family enzyme